MGVSGLGYLSFEVSDLAAWRRYATEFLGLMDVTAEESELRFRLDERAWRISASKGPSDDLAALGFEVVDEAALEDVVARLKAIDVATREDKDLAKRRGVNCLLACSDPSGTPIELYYGAVNAFETPLRSPVGVQGFVTGDQGLGHVVLYAKDAAAAIRFYTEGLGFKLSDNVDMQIGKDRLLELTFLHCNARHHTVAIAPAPLPRRLNHFMLQATHLDDVGFAYDRADKLGVKIANTLGRHSNDHMLSFYAFTPSGFEVEFGWGARTIREPWTVTRHKAVSNWGHKRLSNS